MKRTGRERLWPYCLRLKASPMQRALADRAAALSKEGRATRPAPFVDVGGFDPQKRLPKLELAPLAPAVERSLALATSFAARNAS